MAETDPPNPPDQPLAPRVCELPECGAPLPAGREKYCSDAHGARARMREMRSRPRCYFVEARVCPGCGSVYGVEISGGGRGRPRLFDCDECQNIVRWMRESEPDPPPDSSGQT